MALPIKPYRQGDLDGLCGVHAIINALYVLFPDMKKKEAQKLFRLIMKEIARKAGIQVVWRGIDAQLLRVSLAVAVDWAAREHSWSIKVSRPFARGRVEPPELLQKLRSKIDHGCVAITLVREGNGHWTVITKVTQKMVVLFDSDILTSIRVGNCSLRRSGKRYQVNARETLFLSSRPK